MTSPHQVISVLGVLVILLTAFPAVAAAPKNSDRATSPSTPTSCSNTLGPLPPPPNPFKQPAPSLSGRVDLSVPFTSGIIRLRVACDVPISEALRRHGIPDSFASHWSPPPFDASDKRAGIDRSYKIRVPIGEEKKWVVRLAPHRDLFDWVQLNWEFPVAVTGAPTSPAGRPLTLTTTDPRLSTQTNLSRANVQAAWDRTISFSGVVIAVLDSGLRATHEDAGQWKQLTGYDYVRGIETPPGTAIDTGCWGGHGTHVGTIAAGDTNNGLGVAGAGFNSGILPMRVLNGSTCEIWAASSRDWPLRWARLQGANIVNMSYYFEGPDPDEEAVMAESWANGVTPVGSAANFERNIDATPLYPCAYLYVVCVGANKNDGTRCPATGFGDNGSSWVDFTAPSEVAWGAGSASDTSYIYDSCHTSYSVPLVSGVMALLRSLGKGPQAQYDAMVTGSVARRNTWTTWGEIDAGAALAVP